MRQAFTLYGFGIFLFLYIAFPCRDEGEDKEGEQVSTNDPERVCAFYGDQRGGTNCLEACLYLLGQEHIWQAIKEWPKKVRCCVEPEMTVGQAGEQTHHNGPHVINCQPRE